MRGLALGGGGKCHIVDHISYYAGDSSDDSRFMVTLCDREVIARDYFQTWVHSEVGATCKHCLKIFEAPGAKHEADRPSISH